MMKTLTAAGLLLIAGLAFAPQASAGNAIGYTCDYVTSGSYYQCQGYGTNNAGEWCSVRWTDADSDDDWEDTYAHITSINCHGEIVNDPVPWLP